MPKMQALQSQFQKFVEKAQKQETEMLQANGGSFVAAYVITNSMRQVGLERLRERYNYLTDEVKGGPYGKLIAQQIALYESLEIGGTAPDFTAMTPEGDTLSLHQVKGKLKLLDFWASWCGPCRMLGPVLEELGEEHPEIKICKVNTDDERELAISFGIDSIPCVISFKDGKQIDKSVGFVSKDKLLALLD